MLKVKLRINGIPSIVWGENSSKCFIVIHGKNSNKEDDVIKTFVGYATDKEYQVLSFDLPEHGERKDETDYTFKVQNCVKDLRKIMDYAKENYREINIFAVSLGAYLSLLEYKDEEINEALFLSPIVNLKVIIDNMMRLNNITFEDLMDEQEITTEFGEKIYLDYYLYVKNNPIVKWDTKTYILFGENDNMQDKELMEKFAGDFRCRLSTVKNGEHYFHTEEQLVYYEKWLGQIFEMED
jgi:hypothetical protein